METTIQVILSLSLPLHPPQQQRYSTRGVTTSLLLLLLPTAQTTIIFPPQKMLILLSLHLPQTRGATKSPPPNTAWQPKDVVTPLFSPHPISQKARESSRATPSSTLMDKQHPGMVICISQLITDTSSMDSLASLKFPMW